VAQVCQITGKRPRVGNTVSHANKKAKRRFNINLHDKRFWLEEQKRFVKLRVSVKGMRIIDKLGIEAVVKNIDKYCSKDNLWPLK
jgi:large subunit ribosomal protein L28